MHPSASISVASVALVGVLAPLAAAAAKKSPVQVYAYGNGIGGMQMFSTGGKTFLGDHSAAKDPQAAPVIVTEAAEGVWVATPNTTAAGKTPSWSNLTLSIPASTSTSHDVSLVNPSTNNTSGLITNGFMFFGSFMFGSGGDGSVASLWYAVPSEMNGVYKLKWNETGDSSNGKISLSLKTTPPSNKPKGAPEPAPTNH